MRVESIHLKHSLHFADIKLHFQYHDLPITLILGQQSTGKTTLLRFTYQALTWFAARYKDIRTAGVVMLDHDIMHTRLQSKIDIQVRFPEEIGHLAESSSVLEADTQTCGWQLYKTLNARGVGVSKVETQQLEAMIALYQKAQRLDPNFGLPLIAYYPVDRFVNDVNLLSKNNSAILQPPHAYEVSAIPFTTYARFFEWLREISDLENAQTAHLLQQILKQHHVDEEFFFSQKLADSYAKMSAPALKALNQAIHTVLPDVQQVYLDYYPKLQLMVQYQHRLVAFQQLSNSVKNWIALVGDLVRRLCLLNPNSLFPCQEGEGIVCIDAIDHQLDNDVASVILQRLHSAFPRLQIIATGMQEVLLENAEGMQCFRLEQQQLQPIANTHTKMQHIYSQLHSNDLLEAPSEQLETLMQPNIEHILQQLQSQLSDSQLQELAQLLQQQDGQPDVNYQPE